mgnify:CR=1 FL=1
MILHIPHASRNIPAALRGQFVLDDTALEEERTRVTDAFTDELFVLPDARRVSFGVSRLVVDVERFSHDRDEPMSRAGQGMIYTRTCLGEPLRRALSDEERRFLKSEYYVRHHELLRRAVLDELLARGKALIVDCHAAHFTVGRWPHVRAFLRRLQAGGPQPGEAASRDPGVRVLRPHQHPPHPRRQRGESGHGGDTKRRSRARAGGDRPP